MLILVAIVARQPIILVWEEAERKGKAPMPSIELEETPEEEYL